MLEPPVSLAMLLTVQLSRVVPNEYVRPMSERTYPIKKA